MSAPRIGSPAAVAAGVNSTWLAHGDVMRRSRVARGESLADAARRSGVAPRLLNDIEHGRADPARLPEPVRDPPDDPTWAAGMPG
jgi:hypothetical protein